MRYNGNLCDGCNEPLLENEDIVVCPECATPQHRHCYDKENKCVNTHLHGTDFTWQGNIDNSTSAKTSTLVNQQEKNGELICPNCHHSNPAGSEVCRACGMKFTMFGINVVESIKQQEKISQTPAKDENLPEYKAPFTVGIGEGFEASAEDEAVTQEKEEQPVAGSAEYFNDEANIFKGPYPADDFTCGVKTNTIGAFVRNNAQTYIDKFKRSELKGKNSFNWGAFFFAPYWFFYRRLYKPGVIMLTVQLCISILTAPALNKLLTAYQSFVENLQTMSDTVFEESIMQLQSLMMPALIVSAVTFIMHIVSGFIANGLYKNYVIKNIKLAMTFSTVREKIAHFAKNGGASMLAVLIAYVAETGLSYLASYLMY